MPLNNSQKALLHVAKADLGLEDDTYRDILRSIAGVESSKDMTPIDFERVMARMKELGFKGQRPHRPAKIRAASRDPLALPSPAQLHRLNTLFEELGWYQNERRVAFCKRMLRKPWPQTRQEANKIIEALKAMAAREKKGANL